MFLLKKLTRLCLVQIMIKEYNQLICQRYIAWNEQISYMEESLSNTKKLNNTKKV